MKNALILAAALGLVSAAPGTPLVQRDTPRVGRSAPKRSFSDTKPLQKIPSADSTSNVEYSGNWAGAVSIGTGYNKVSGTIIVPEVSGQSGAASSAWVGIDGDTCQTAILQTGISTYADNTFDAWYEWIPDYAYSFSGFSLSVGDEIYMEVDASSKTTGTATLENLTTGQKVSHTFSQTPSTLCETNAEWIVEAFQEGGSQVNLADFGTITFTDASASGSAGTIGPGDATVIDISENGSASGAETSCSVGSSTVTCEYTG